jgi:cytoskeleton protein RodZ
VGAFGERLKREREKRKITLDDVAQATKISTRLLRAIEEEKFDQLPGGIFNKGFVRSYARHLGLDEDQAVADYTEAFRAVHPEQSAPLDPEAEGRKILEQRALRVQQERPRLERIPWGKAAIVLLLIAFGVALWGSYSRFSKTPSDIAINKQKNSRPEQRRIQPALKSPVPVSIQPADSHDGPASVTIQDSISGVFRVAIHAREDSWIQIKADGKDVLEDTLQADAEKSIQANDQLVIKAGNIGALDFWFNGQKLPVQGDLDQVKTITFNSTGVVTATPKIQAVSESIAR